MSVIQLGLDASKGYADCCFLNEAGSVLKSSQRYDDTPAGHAAVRQALATLAARDPEVRFQVGLEASGGLERNWLRLFTQGETAARCRVYRLNPLAVKRFLGRELHRNVTDPSSAQGIARYLRSGLRPAEVPYEPDLEGPLVLYRFIRNSVERSIQLQNELHSLLGAVHPDLVQFCRRGFPQWVLCLLNRYPTAPQLARARPKTVAGVPYITAKRAATLIAAARESVASLRDAETGLTVRALAQELRALERRIEQRKSRLTGLLAAEPTVRRLQTIPGIGLWTAVVLRLEIGPFDRFATDNAVVAFAGLDPHYHQSGDGEVRYSISKRGRAEIRAALYMSVLTAIRYNPAIQAFYERLLSRGKLAPVALTACMGKLLRQAYACVISEQDFDPRRAARDRARHTAAVPGSEQASDPLAGGCEPLTEALPGGEPPATVALTAPVSHREARRRRAATTPQADRSRRERGHGTALPGHDRAATQQ